MNQKKQVETMSKYNLLDLLILAPQEFMDEKTDNILQPLVDHKNATGMITKAISLDQINKEYSGRDEAERVKACLFQAYLNEGIQYAMLVGDDDKFPTRYTRWTTGEKRDFHTLYVPTDQYYECLTRPDGTFDNWDANQDGVFGETILYGTSPTILNPDKLYMIPQIIVGRVPASSKDEVSNYISKVIEYETQDPSSLGWKNYMLVVLGFDKNGLKEPFNLESPISDLLPKVFKNIYTFGYNQGNDEEPNAAKINQHINNGVGFGIYHGHGYDNASGWAINSVPSHPIVSYVTEDILGSSGKQGLINDNKLPIIFAESCYTGEFGPLPPQTPYWDINGVMQAGTLAQGALTSMPPQPACIQQTDVIESLAEAMTVKRNTGTTKIGAKKISDMNIGAIAYIGATLTSGQPDYDMLYLFLKALDDGSSTLGGCWRSMMIQYYKKHIPPDPNTRGLTVDGALIMPWRYCLFGDPSLRLEGQSNLIDPKAQVFYEPWKLKDLLDREPVLRKILDLYKQGDYKGAIATSNKYIRVCNKKIKENPDLSSKLKQPLAVAFYTKANAFTMQDKTRAANLALGKVKKLGYVVTI
jgi:hypothetical protein